MLPSDTDTRKIIQEKEDVEKEVDKNKEVVKNEDSEKNKESEKNEESEKNKESEKNEESEKNQEVARNKDKEVEKEEKKLEKTEEKNEEKEEKKPKGEELKEQQTTKEQTTTQIPITNTQSTTTEQTTTVHHKESPFLTSSVIKKKEIGVGSVTDEETEKIQQKFDEEHLKGEILFRGNCKLFRMNESKVVTRGVGKIYITKGESNGMVRIVMVRDKLMKLGCNHFIEPWSEILGHEIHENTWVWSTIGDTIDEVSDKQQTYIVKFKEDKEAKGFKNSFEIGKENNRVVLESKK
ncbi:Ran-specific GTPase-activating protein 1 [Hamiltosporidium tvaerminnensis]|uniref:Ran-specific GTPase-activating protein 1 n=1 Tax=Hamiltosporidium tvaerminnensis TaxID=1176355 RepID=A0A4Q9L952_9MICR|nr:Ran GTPase binding protein Sbp1 [Hamiltosporidium tvaerminnensis]TBU04273.1 Ran-specific GTPase-activating protein 1 [Hamiltosporidium tvaerminnensis]